MLFALAIAKVDVKAANVLDSGTDEGVTWTLYDDKSMTITGTGEIKRNLGHTKHRSLVTSIQIENGITSIGIGAFEYFTNISTVTIASSVTSIEGFAFYNCKSLSNITMPNSIVSIGREAFRDCSSLTNITIPNSVTKIEGYAFLGSALKTISLPNSVTDLSGGVFEDCKSLSEAVLPDSLKTIPGHTFNGCENLQKIIIPSSITEIGYCAFHSCSSLTDVIIPDSVLTINEKAFIYCSSLKNVSMSDQLYANTDIDECFSPSPWLLSKKAPLSGSNGDFTYLLDADGTLTVYGKGTLHSNGGNLGSYMHAVKTIIIPADTTEIKISLLGYFSRLEKIINNSDAVLELSGGQDYSWCNAKDTTEPIYEIFRGTAVKVNGKLAKHYTIMFNGNKPSSGSMKSMKVEADKSITIPKNKITKNG